MKCGNVCALTIANEKSVIQYYAKQDIIIIQDIMDIHYEITWNNRDNRYIYVEATDI